MLQERIQLIGNKERIDVSLEISHAMISYISNDLYKDISQIYLLVIGRYGISNDNYYRLMEVRRSYEERHSTLQSYSYIEFNRSQFRDINIDMICE